MPLTPPSAGRRTPPVWRDFLARALALLALLVGSVSIVVTISDDDGDPTTPPTITFRVNDTRADQFPSKDVTVPTAAVQAAAPTLENDLRDETPAEAEQAAPAQLATAQETVEQIRGSKPPLPTAGASAGFDGCVTRFVANQSSRRGVRPIWQVLHYTVSPNRAGWSDVNAIVALFDRPSSQASSTFIIDAEGNCAYIVPIESKPWTQAAGNPLSISYEIINSGSESQFMGTAGYARLRSVMRQVSRRTGIPMRAGSVYPARSGIVQHKDGGLAWGGHVDITPFAKSQVIRLVTTDPCNTRCRRVKSLRGRHQATHDGLRAQRCRTDGKPYRRASCRTLAARNHAIHAAARQEKIAL